MEINWWKQQVSRHYSSNVPLEKAIVEWLIKGPTNSDAQATISPSTKILGVSIVEGVCYVNLDSAFLKTPTGINSNVVLYAIVNSLTELDNINKVQILVDGAQSTSDSTLEFSLGTSYERDTSMVMQAVERDLMKEGD